MTKTYMARKIVQELFGMDKLPDPKNVQVRNMVANKKKVELEDLYQVALKAEGARQVA